MKFINEFKAFALKGNVVDLAVGVIIGTAFGKVVSSLVADILMPPIGLLTGGVQFGALSLPLTGGDSPVVIYYGSFLQTCFDFLIIAFCVYILIRAINKLQTPKEAPKPPGPTPQEKLLVEIRDLLKEKR